MPSVRIHIHIPFGSGMMELMVELNAASRVRGHVRQMHRATQQPRSGRYDVHSRLGRMMWRGRRLQSGWFAREAHIPTPNTCHQVPYHIPREARNAIRLSGEQFSTCADTQSTPRCWGSISCSIWSPPPRPYYPCINKHTRAWVRSRTYTHTHTCAHAKWWFGFGARFIL